MSLREKCEALARDVIDQHRRAGTPVDVIDVADACEQMALAFGRKCAEDAYDGCEPPAPSNEALERAIVGTLERCAS